MGTRVIKAYTARTKNGSSLTTVCTNNEDEARSLIKKLLNMPGRKAAYDLWLRHGSAVTMVEYK